MKKILCLMVFLLTLAACQKSSEPAETVHNPFTREQADAVLNTYYQNPQPKQLLEAFAYFDEQSELSKEDKVKLIGFASGLAHFRPEDWKAVENNGKWKGNIVRLIPAVPAKKEILEKVLTSPKSFPFHQVQEVQFFWGVFGASGNEQILRNIFMTIHYPKADHALRHEAFSGVTARKDTHPLVEKLWEEREKDISAFELPRKAPSNKTPSVQKEVATPTAK